MKIAVAFFFLVSSVFITFSKYYHESIAAGFFSANTDDYMVRSMLLKEAMENVGALSPERAVDIWAEGLRSRSAAAQYSVLTSNLKKKYEKQLDKNFPNWVTGISSPWVDTYNIIKVDKISPLKYEFHLVVSLATSTGPAGDYKVKLSLVKEDDYWRISGMIYDEQLNVYIGFNPL